MTGTAAPAAAAVVAVVAVAFSGGRDSLALLHATCQAAGAQGLEVVALHVHHGLLPEADGWLRWAQRLCRRWQARGWPLRLRWARLSGSPAVGDSVEAWARAGRYAALTDLAQQEGATLLLLAQHRRDQAETVLLQALRGGGPAGLSAMPALADRAGLRWARPWLSQPREAIDAYVQRYRLVPLQDPSNLDPRWARNRLRLQVWPALTAAFAGAEAALAGAARRAQEAQAVLAEVAALDLAGLVNAQGHLNVAGWRALSAARQANALRAWWRAQAGQGAPASLIARLLAEVPSAGAACWPADGHSQCVLYRGGLQWAPLRQWPGQPVSGGAAPGGPPTGQVIDLSRPGCWCVPGWGGQFEVQLAQSGGAAPAQLRALALIRRVGKERFQSAASSLPRSLKKQFQAAGVPAHLRTGPLLFEAGEPGSLVFVPGLGIDARCWLADGQAQLRLVWQPKQPGPTGCGQGQDQHQDQNLGQDRAAG